MILTLGCVAEVNDAGPNPLPNELNAPLALEIQTASGPIRGQSTEGLRTFKGIPFAQPPLGALRFAPPQPIAPWVTPLSADVFSPACLQSSTLLADEMSEDCLTLNIWAPDRQKSKPVMVWIHGGGFTFWSSAFELFDGGRLARAGDVVVVSMNYRLGLLGFLPMQDEAFGESRVLGLLDQQLALEWVRDNIAAFGGDPNNVTVFGESAGGFSICYHLGMPSSDGLFHKAIIQSGGSCSPPKDASSVTEVYRDMLTLSGCQSEDAEQVLDCLRGLNGEALMDVQRELPKNIIGTSLLWPLATSEPKVGGGALRRMHDGAPNIPILAGSNANEFTFFTAIGGLSAISEADYDAAIGHLKLSREAEAEVRSIYNAEHYGSIRKAIEAMGTDAVFTCPAFRFARQTSTSAYPVYLYQFRMGLGHALNFVGATHGAEIPYIFDTGEAGLLGLPIEVESEQAAKFQRLWSHFAHAGEPPSELAWSRFDAESASMMLFEPEWRIVMHEYQDVCALFQTDIL